MAEVAAFLTEHFQDSDACPPPEDLGRLLEDADPDTTEIDNMLMTLEVLLNSSEFAAGPLDSQSVRVYNGEETDNLPQEVAGLMQYLASKRAITYKQHKIVIHALMRALSREVTVDVIKVLTLLVLQAHKSEPPVLIDDDLMAVSNSKAVMH